jgi:pimeloyl-ACP methyl ester carboxylesterase
MQRLKGLRDLVHDAIDETTLLVADTHRSVAEKPFAVLSAIEPLKNAALTVQELERTASGLVYDSIRAINRGVQRVGDVGETLATELGAQEVASLASAQVDEATTRELSVWTDFAQAVLNGVVGDYLSKRKNGLAVHMGFRHEGEELVLEREALRKAYPEATGKLCVLVHGLACTEAGFFFDAERLHGDARASYGFLLARDLGYTPLYLRYNSGQHISENGRAFAAELEALVNAYPVAVEEIVLIGHSMGGLVSRSAAHYGKEAGHTWAQKLRHVFCLGSPHHGSPLEKAGNVLASVLSAFDLPGTQVPAKVLNARSAGIKDLRFGYTLDEHWIGKDPNAFLRDERELVPFVEGVSYAYVGATISKDPAHPVGYLLGDLLVRADSARGEHENPKLRVPFHMGEVLAGIHHVALMNHKQVYAQILRCLGGQSSSGPCDVAQVAPESVSG